MNFVERSAVSKWSSRTAIRALASKRFLQSSVACVHFLDEVISCFGGAFDITTFEFIYHGYSVCFGCRGSRRSGFHYRVLGQEVRNREFKAIYAINTKGDHHSRLEIHCFRPYLLSFVIRRSGLNQFHAVELAAVVIFVFLWFISIRQTPYQA